MTTPNVVAEPGKPLARTGKLDLALVVADLQAGASRGAIARKYGVSKSAVRQRLKAVSPTRYYVKLLQRTDPPLAALVAQHATVERRGALMVVAVHGNPEARQAFKDHAALRARLEAAGGASVALAWW